MKSYNLVPPISISGYVKDIRIYNNESEELRTILPFFADGYPGIIYHTAVNKMTLLPSGQLMKPFFIYGQTLHPIELTIDGRFQMVIFQLYPFALRSLFNLDAQNLNEDCFDLTNAEATTMEKLLHENSQEGCVSLITKLISGKIATVSQPTDLIKDTIHLILESNGTISIKEINEKLNINERSLQRLFRQEVGISPKKFAKIIQFQASLEQLSKEEYFKLSQIAYDKGFADQSHFIRIFRQYTGNTPSAFVK